MFRLIRRRQKKWSNWKWLRRLVAMKTRLHQRIGCISSCHWIVYLRAKRLTGEIVGCVGYICRGQHWRRQVEIRITIRNQEWSYESGCWVMGLVIGCTGLLCNGATQDPPEGWLLCDIQPLICRSKNCEINNYWLKIDDCTTNTHRLLTKT